MRWMEDVEKDYGRGRLRDGDRRQLIGKNAHPLLGGQGSPEGIQPRSE
jgi:hypothetical protein